MLQINQWPSVTNFLPLPKDGISANHAVDLLFEVQRILSIEWDFEEVQIILKEDEFFIKAQSDLSHSSTTIKKSIKNEVVILIDDLTSFNDNMLIGNHLVVAALPLEFAPFPCGYFELT
jgi:hypothetical protein